MSWQLTQIILLEFADSESFSLMADCNVWYRGATAPCPAVSRILQLPRIRPFGIPFFFIYSLKLLTIVSVGFSETPWNFLNPVTWIVTAGGPSDPITNNCLEMKYGNVLMAWKLKSMSKHLHEKTYIHFISHTTTKRWTKNNHNEVRVYNVCQQELLSPSDFNSSDA